MPYENGGGEGAPPKLICALASSTCVTVFPISIRTCLTLSVTRDLALASMARDDPPASSTAVAVHGKVGSESET